MELVKKLSTVPAKKVESFDQIADDAYAMLRMLDTGIPKGKGYANGVALHHAQVSETPFNFFVVADEFKSIFGGGRQRRIVINPKIVDQKDFVPYSEGCLSFLDRAYVNTKRFDRITLIYQYANLSGDIKNPYPLKLNLHGFEAFMVQHECDHAKGENIYDGRFDEYNERVELDKAK